MRTEFELQPGNELFVRALIGDFTNPIGAQGVLIDYILRLRHANKEKAQQLALYSMSQLLENPAVFADEAQRMPAFCQGFGHSIHALYNAFHSDIEELIKAVPAQSPIPDPSQMPEEVGHPTWQWLNNLKKAEDWAVDLKDLVYGLHGDYSQEVRHARNRLKTVYEGFIQWHKLNNANSAPEYRFYAQLAKNEEDDIKRVDYILNQSSNRVRIIDQIVQQLFWGAAREYAKDPNRTCTVTLKQELSLHEMAPGQGLDDCKLTLTMPITFEPLKWDSFARNSESAKIDIYYELLKRLGMQETPTDSQVAETLRFWLDGVPEGAEITGLCIVPESYDAFLIERRRHQVTAKLVVYNGSIADTQS